MATSHFDKKAENWDNNPEKIKRASVFAEEIIKFIKPSKKTKALEFGCGTGLLSFQLQNYFKEITLVDTSEGMLNVLKEKIKQLKITNFKPLKINILKNFNTVSKIDVIYTLMTMHHIKNIDKTIQVFNLILNKNGYLCIADLVEEDGTFHNSSPDFDGHNGFKKENLTATLLKNGFKTIHYSVCYEIKKNNKTYPLFLLIAEKI
ncbi:class I SAM-dependent methyltransferase [Lutibacter sp. A80]|uniref:class I SAM-dependent DNA methyltransferase n=1 Tax=Lutibacter sp. A80 TaxID=2918453 RepID=UPI001F057F71|nr:class I SAM-dependent methyltransferase [Lutibacter sp. A80]UMB61343.1 class I SAM-dependent methyltransferase [Lutibacter sp. A80]